MKIRLSSILFALTLAGSQTTYANDWSIGLLAGQTEVKSFNDVACFEGEFDSFGSNIAGEPLCADDLDGTALGINLAYQLTDFIGFEAGYVDLDEYETPITIGGDVEIGSLSVSPTALYGAVTGSIPILNRLSLSGRIGVYDLDSNFDGQFLVDVDVKSESDSDLYLGASFDLMISDQLTAQLRYDDFGLDVVSLGLQYRFGSY